MQMLTMVEFIIGDDDKTGNIIWLSESMIAICIFLEIFNLALMFSSVIVEFGRRI